MTRHIQPAAMKLIEDRLAGNSLAQACIAERNARQLYIEAIKALVGIREVGKNNGPEVTLFLATVDLAPGNSWCMALQQTGLAYVESKLGVKSPVAAGGLVTGIWNTTDKAQRVKKIPLAGAIAILQHDNDKVHGHTGMVLDCDEQIFHTIEGNTAEGLDNLTGGESHGGEAVRFVTRKLDYHNYQANSKDLKLLGFLKPF